ncbi:hypothetical protein JCM10213_007779 [Rhodosporidiobolus nylandii]
MTTSAAPPFLSAPRANLFSDRNAVPFLFTVDVEERAFFSCITHHPIRPASTPAHPASVVHLSTVPIVDLFIDILEEILKDPSPADWEDLCSLAVTQDGLNRRGHEWAGQLGLGNDAWKKRVSAVMDRDGYATLRDKWEPMSRQWWKKKEAVKMMKQAVGPKDEPMYTDEDVDKTFTFVSTLLNLPYGSHARMPPAKR